MAKAKIDLDALYNRDAARTWRAMETFARENYGPRCKEYEPDCCVCRVWRTVADFRAATDLS